MPSTTLDGDFVIQALLLLLLVAQLYRVFEGVRRRPDREETAREMEAKEQTRKAIEMLLQQQADIVQISKEARSIAHETRDLVRGLEKTHIISAETDKQMLAVLTKLEAAFTGVASGISELVGELRSSRTAR